MAGRSERQGEGAPAARRHTRLAVTLAGIVAGMLGLSYAAVPLYRIFCQVTGFGGTTQVAEQAPDRILDRKITVRFDANVAQGMPWKFRPVQNEITVRIGESALAFYGANNPTSRTVHGTATFNVTPEIAGSYFNKIECFCFTEQTLTAGASVDMPVTFFIDPEIVNDPDASSITEITLSYTFFAVDDESGVATNSKVPVRGGT